VNYFNAFSARQWQVYIQAEAFSNLGQIIWANFMNQQHRSDGSSDVRDGKVTAQRARFIMKYNHCPVCQINGSAAPHSSPAIGGAEDGFNKTMPIP